MNRFFLTAGMILLALTFTTGCFPDDYLDDKDDQTQQPVPKPEPKPEPEPGPTPEPDNGLSYDDLDAYDVLKSADDGRLTRQVYLTRFFNHKPQSR